MFNINTFLLVITCLLVLFLSIIIFLFIFEKNLTVQEYLEQIQTKLNTHKNNFFSSKPENVRG